MSAPRLMVNRTRVSAPTDEALSLVATIVRILRKFNSKAAKVRDTGGRSSRGGDDHQARAAIRSTERRPRALRKSEKNNEDDFPRHRVCGSADRHAGRGGRSLRQRRRLRGRAVQRLQLERRLCRREPRLPVGQGHQLGRRRAERRHGRRPDRLQLAVRHVGARPRGRHAGLGRAKTRSRVTSSPIRGSARCAAAAATR
jgi:hypothetical protein